jgi:hypothetical protein
MSKDTEIRLVGQPIFKQIISLIDAVNMQSLILKHNSDHYYKAFKSRMHVVTMLFGILSRCDSMTETLSGKTSGLDHLWPE